LKRGCVYVSSCLCLTFACFGALFLIYLILRPFISYLTLSSILAYSITPRLPIST
jgi:hypothetical protein